MPSTVLDRYEEYNVQDELAGTVGACVEGLGRSLADEPADGPARVSHGPRPLGKVAVKAEETPSKAAIDIYQKQSN